MAATPTCRYLEYLDITGAVLIDPPRVIKGMVSASTTPGSGVVWDEAAVKTYAA